MSAQSKRGLTIHSKERYIIVNIIRCCEAEAVQRYLGVSFAKATRAAKYCNVSSGTKAEGMNVITA
jgi:hypothetical protein